MVENIKEIVYLSKNIKGFSVDDIKMDDFEKMSKFFIKTSNGKFIFSLNKTPRVGINCGYVAIIKDENGRHQTIQLNKTSVTDAKTKLKEFLKPKMISDIKSSENSSKKDKLKNALSIMEKQFKKSNLDFNDKKIKIFNLKEKIYDFMSNIINNPIKNINDFENLSLILGKILNISPSNISENLNDVDKNDEISLIPYYFVFDKDKLQLNFEGYIYKDGKAVDDIHGEIIVENIENEVSYESYYQERTFQNLNSGKINILKIDNSNDTRIDKVNIYELICTTIKPKNILKILEENGLNVKSNMNSYFFKIKEIDKNIKIEVREVVKSTD